MSQNLIDYETLENAAKNYENQGTALAQVITTLSNENSILAEGWKNKVSVAFLTKYQEVYEPTIKNCGQDLLKLAQFIRNYSSGIQLDDDEISKLFL